MSRIYDHAVVTKGPRSTLNDAVIDHLSLEETLRVWRYSPAENFQPGDPTTDYFLRHLAHLIATNGKEYLRLSKEIGY